MDFGYKMYKKYVFVFGLGLACQDQRPYLSYQSSTPAKTIYGKKTSKSAKYPWSLRYKKRSVEIAMHLGLDNIIKLKFTTNFDRCAILNVLNCLTKNF